MKKILLSLGMIVFVGAVAVGATGAFFSDTETSTGNTFTAGAIDLTIDNDSYYNGVFQDGLSWELDELAGHLFFNFADLKPGDWGEDTISVHVSSNDAYACAYVTKTHDNENTIVEPEEELSDNENEGELDDELTFIWWADDGDNVLEEGEKILNEGILGDAPLNYKHTIILADSNENIWGEDGDPLSGDSQTTYYIGKAWCFGDLTKIPVTPGNNNPAIDPGFTCDGSTVTNISQTDSTMLDVSFYAVQSRNNDDFICGDNPVNPGIPDHVSFFTEDFEGFDGGTPGAQSGLEAGEVIDNDIWDESGTVRAVDINGSVAAEFDAGVGTVEKIWTVVAVDTTGYGDIDLSYDLMIQDIENPDTFEVAYSIDGGSGWTTVETYIVNQTWETETTSLSAGADNQSDVRIRFMLTGTTADDIVYIDNIELVGTEL